jgi:glucose-1-phosphate thymidylyltransferase
MCAKESAFRPAVIAYADTLIRADFDLDPQQTLLFAKVDQPKLMV